MISSFAAAILVLLTMTFYSAELVYLSLFEGMDVRHCLGATFVDSLYDYATRIWPVWSSVAG